MPHPEQPVSEQLADINKPVEEKEPGLEIANTKELKNVIEVASNLAEKVQRDEDVTFGEVLDLEKALSQMKIDCGGVELTIEEAKQIPDLQENAKLWQKIIESEGYPGELTEKITYLPPEIARVIKQKKVALEVQLHESQTPILGLNKLKFLSLSSAKELDLWHNGPYIINLYSLTTISAETANFFETKRNLTLSMLNLKNLSNEAARALSKFQGILYCPNKIMQQINQYKK